MRTFFVAVLIGLGAAAVSAAELIMVEENGCVWCARWNSEIGPIYPRTLEGKTAPLRRVDIREAPPPGVSFKAPAIYTPTFVLVENGAEIGRIEGYPGEDFFW
ncbi:MAG: thioredoxin family protein, partial [Rhodobacteraceae bacterium]|nr:thioredoxin family protein [Paracoccaceae bacterium]